eukprot:gene33073-40007_t
MNNSRDIQMAIEKGYKVKVAQGIVGFGLQEYEAVSKQVLSLSYTASRLPWGFLASTDAPNARIGSVVATVTQFYRTPLWSLNPCRVVNVVKDEVSRSVFFDAFDAKSGAFSNPSRLFSNNPKTAQDKVRQTSVSYGTVYGHMLSGQESLCVYMPVSTSTRTPVAAQQPVVVALCSVAKGHGLLGRIIEPLIGPLQRKFLLGHVKSGKQRESFYFWEKRG